jgi:hypothetical protein
MAQVRRAKAKPHTRAMGGEFDDYGLLYYSAVKPLTEFIADQDDNIPAIKKYIESNLKSLFELKQRYPKLFKK